MCQQNYEKVIIYKGAVRIVFSDESIAENTDETISALEAKHPDTHP